MPDKPKKKKDGGQRYDWETIKLDYVTHPESSIRWISDKYGIRRDTVQKKCKADDWFATKKKYQKKVVSKAMDKAVSKNANKLANLMTIADGLEQVLLKAVEDDKQFNRHIVPETVDDMTNGVRVQSMTEKTMEKIDTKALKEAASTLKLLEDMKRSLHNIQKAEQLNRDRREDERLRIEKERWEAEKQRQNLATGDEGSHGVVILPEVMIGDDNNG